MHNSIGRNTKLAPAKEKRVAAAEAKLLFLIFGIATRAPKIKRGGDSRMVFDFFHEEENRRGEKGEIISLCGKGKH